MLLKWQIPLLCAAVLTAVSARAFDASTTGTVSLRYQSGADLSLLDPGVQDPDAGFAAAYLMPELDFDQGEWLNGTIELYTGELSARTFSPDSLDLYGVESAKDYFNDTYFVRQAYLNLSPVDSINFYVGEREIVGGSKLLFDNYQPSFTFDYDMTDALDVPLSLELNAVKVEPYKLYDPSRTSMFYDAELSYSFSLFEYITLFYSNFRDTDNTLAPLLNNIVYTSLFNRTTYNDLVSRYGKPKAAQIMACLQQEYASGGPVRSSSTSINWTGITGDRYFGRLEVGLTGILEFGSGTIEGNNCFANGKPFTRSFDTYGYLADLKLKYHIKDVATLGVFFNLSSGDKTPAAAIVQQRTLNSFISIFPYNTETSLFFNGGINQNINTGSLAMAGRRGLGDVAYGADLDFYPSKPIELTVIPALIYPEVGDSDYGFETDFKSTYTLNTHISFPFEFDYFKPGGLFQRYNVSRVVQVLFGADIAW
ncbi:MAG: hypothetical protein M1491_06515 [Deltaproteobacteria bacterium]|nr:hypothetical protein [Deltaproteobacteria bacterium]MCL5276249.1 hypothetical protein [Deltaproteobacteria bacterium]